jgi:hypothetical protein
MTITPSKSYKQIIIEKHNHDPMITINLSSPVIIYVVTTTNKWLLISESCGDLNRCTPCRGKPDQHATRFPRSVRVWSKTIRISRGPHIATLRETPIDLDRSHCSREKWLLTQSTARQLTDPWVRTRFLSQANQWSRGCKPSSCHWQTTRPTGHISPACDRYVQYLLTGANPSVLNRHRRGLQPWRCRLATYQIPLPNLPNQVSPLST